MIYLDATSSYPPFECARNAMNEAFMTLGNHQSQHSYGRHMQVEIDSLRRLMAQKHNVDSSQVSFTYGGSDGIYRTLTAIIPHLHNAQILLSPLLYPSFYEILNSLQPFTNHTIHMLEVDKNGQYILNNLKSQYDFIIVETLCSELGIVQNSLQMLMNTVLGCYIIDDSAGLIERVLEPLDIPKDISYRCIYTGEKMGVAGIGYMITSTNTVFMPLTKHSGTLSFAILMALKATYEHLLNTLDNYQQHIKKLSTMLINTFKQNSNWSIVIENSFRSYGIITLSHKTYNNTLLQHMLEQKGILVGIGYACETGTHNVSRALTSINYDTHRASNTIRISLHHHLTETDIVKVINIMSNM